MNRLILRLISFKSHASAQFHILGNEDLAETAAGVWTQDAVAVSGRHAIAVRSSRGRIVGRITSHTNLHHSCMHFRIGNFEQLPASDSFER